MRFALLLCLAALPALPATAAELVCELPSASNGALLETMKLVALNGHVSRIWHKFERTSYWDEHEQIDTIVFQSTTKSVGFAGSPNFTVVVTQNDPTTPHADRQDHALRPRNIDYRTRELAPVPFKYSPAVESQADAMKPIDDQSVRGD
jgi:hypothetical protein